MACILPDADFISPYTPGPQQKFVPGGLLANARVHYIARERLARMESKPLTVL
jgi:hypothetical protein